MKILNKNSLAITIDNLNNAFFYGKKIDAREKSDIADWIVSRQGLPRSYAGMFAPTEADFKTGIALFTGEKVKTMAATAHILGEEASRALILMKDRRKSTIVALELATEGFLERLNHEGRTKGTYCCGTCTPSYWRHLLAGGLKNQEQELRAGMVDLKKHRDGKGRWRRYPFYYTLLALNEIDLELVMDELRYVAPVMERAMRRKPNGRYGLRRFDLMARILGRI